MPDDDLPLPLPLPLPLTAGRYVVEAKPWDSEFFDRLIGSLSWLPATPDDPQRRLSDLREISRRCDGAGYALVECHVDIADFGIVAALEEVGFRLVDSRMRFLTKWSLDDVPETVPTAGSIRPATTDDRDRIVELTHGGFTTNDRFVSRFKNPEYFSDDLAHRYFEAWIDSTAFADDSATAVYEVDGAIVGYYIYQVRGEYEGLPVVKGILTAVEPAYRGADGQLAMQAFLYRRLGLSEWFLDNTTQLTNTAVIRNHMRSGKRLEETVLTFYRRAGR